MSPRAPDEEPEALRERSVAALAAARAAIAAWTDRVRPAGGARGRLRWAATALRESDVASTAYVLGGLKSAGLLDRVWTAADRAAGAAWVRGMQVGAEQYRDPALLGRRPEEWPANDAWPSPALLEVVNQYSRNVLAHCTPGGLKELPPAAPPPGWPQAGDDPAAMIEWLRTRSWNVSAWGAGSHAQRLMTYMVQWHKQGLLPLSALHEALNFVFSIQDPATGLWGTPDQSLNVRINGTFKLFPVIREQLWLPLPHAAKIMDQVLAQMARPGYDEAVGACDEWDNWYVIALAREEAGGHREEEIRAAAARRIVRMLELFGKDDGGLSYFPDRCMGVWCGVRMAPELPQGEALALGVLAPAINVCLDLGGLRGAGDWPGVWRMRSHLRESPELRERIVAGLNRTPSRYA